MVGEVELGAEYKSFFGIGPPTLRRPVSGNNVPFPVLKLDGVDFARQVICMQVWKALFKKLAGDYTQMNRTF